MSQKTQSILTRVRCWLIVVCILWLAVPAFAEQKTVTKNQQDTNGFHVVQFSYEDSWFSRPATMPQGVPHYDATITVFRVVDGKTERVCEPWRGVFTDGKCYEDNLADIVSRALKTATNALSVKGARHAVGIRPENAQVEFQEGSEAE